MAFLPGQSGNPNGRPPGPSKKTELLKSAILQAAEDAGGENGLVGYLTLQATQNPGPFMSLLGKVLPSKIVGDDENPISIIHRLERVIVDPANTDSKSIPAPPEASAV